MNEKPVKQSYKAEILVILLTIMAFILFFPLIYKFIYIPLSNFIDSIPILSKINNAFPLK
jgi:hypothetical protein